MHYFREKVLNNLDEVFVVTYFVKIAYRLWFENISDSRGFGKMHENPSVENFKGVKALEEKVIKIRKIRLCSIYSRKNSLKVRNPLRSLYKRL